MRCIAGGVLVLVLVGPALRADDKPKDQPKTPAQEYEALVKEFNQAQQTFFQAYREAKTDAERQKVLEEKRPKPEKWAARFFELAQKNPKDPAAVDALVWVVRNVRQAGAGKDNVRAQALASLIRDHITSDKVIGLCESMIYQDDPPSEAFLRKMLEKNPGKEAQGRACLALAIQLHNGPYRNERVKDIEDLLERAIKDYGDVKHPFFGTVGKKAKNELFEIRHLAVGKEAPDMEGQDQDGKPFKLSQYRGKVVLLDFWGNW
jgi:hypothetical protein